MSTVWGVGKLFHKRTIDVWEWKQSDILKKRLPNNPNWSALAEKHAAMSFTPLQLAHAVVKADFLNPTSIILPGIGFLLQASQIVDFNQVDFRLANGGATALNDFSGTSLCGRLAQGFTLLYADKKGYSFVGPLRTHLVACGALSPGAKAVKAADFLFEDANKDRIIVESKGSFADTGNDPTIVKTKLKRALENQVAPWINKLTPPASKGFVFLSQMRETGHKEKSALIFVDPPSDQIIDPVDVPEDWLKRHNYAAWLTIMGLPRPAQRLRARDESRLRKISLPIFKVGRWKIVATQPYYHWGFGTGFGVGMEASALEMVSDARSGRVENLIGYRGLEGVDDEGMFRGSLMHDGSYLGPLRGRDLIGFRTFIL
ncbi:hypothetical protein OEG84_21560 [Hoeflea sp. G2-23]|uniref:Uncharacterized protein n=1 Tax=Hoeflea algicola TaxID=2983763 RepID=A0ABT3ZEJ3_9HYPH|nr:hypothetical protein [Hoeflea algicola]MCY0150221.1 hypothetical protein [Hoeflea algicola]